jgi:hypothetical protein
LYHDNRLQNQEEGLISILEASLLLEKDKTIEKLQELNLSEAAEKVKGI